MAMKLIGCHFFFKTYNFRLRQWNRFLGYAHTLWDEIYIFIHRNVTGLSYGFLHSNLKKCHSKLHNFMFSVPFFNAFHNIAEAYIFFFQYDNNMK